MIATELLDKAKDHNAWRKHAHALRRSANVLWDEFTRVLVEALAEARRNNTEPNLDAALETFETVKLLYGLALETALKGWIVEHFPAKVEVRVAMDGTGEATSAELRTVGVPVGSGHNLLALAEAAELFGDRFQFILRTDDDKSVVRNICRDLAEVVQWRGRYPVPLSSGVPLRLDPNVPARALAHFMRDWLDPVLDALLQNSVENAVHG
jgi:hypothetical protein